MGLRGDVEMERWVAEIKIRAVRRIGELSKELEKSVNRHISLSSGEKMWKD
jgi:hypothetical protein